MKLICGIPTKNEEWIIGKTLNVLSIFCDKIVILDDNSNDKTETICKSFEKVEFIKRYSKNVTDTGMSALGKTELFDHVTKYNPEYILMLDADEIPTPNFINFFNNIDNSINAWSVRFINLFKDEYHYRKDNFKTTTGVNINHDPFLNNGWRKTILIKYNKNYNYKYDISKKIGGISKYHPSPENIPAPILNTEEFYIIHYGKLNHTYISGEKDERYAKIEYESGKETLQKRLRHHQLCRTGSGPNGPEYVECQKEWFWS
uniref:Glycosyltransferase Family 2 Protein n=1 Tax=Florenciella sp. virus SA2 TaxID=3240092 RepID=A0AB39J7J9_9VIRU